MAAMPPAASDDLPILEFPDVRDWEQWLEGNHAVSPGVWLAQALIEAGRMREPGHAHVLAAQADGRWQSAYEPQSRATVPADLQAALNADPAASAFFATLTGAQRYSFLYRLHTVAKPEARQRRITQYVELLREGRTLR